MAIFKYLTHLSQFQHGEFDKLHRPGTVAPNPGIYRCTACGDEIVVNARQLLPTASDHPHAGGVSAARWQLLVCALSADSAKSTEK